MNKILVKLVSLVFCCALSFLLSCSGNDLSGATSETTSGQISAVVINEEGFHVSNAKIYLHRTDALKDPFENTVLPVDSTDLNGKFVLSDLDSTNYTIEIVDSLGNRAQVIAVYDSITDEFILKGVEQIQLRSAGSLYGTVEHITTQKVYVQLYGLGRVVEVDSSGYFVFKDLPRGKVTLKIIADSDSIVEERDTFEIKSSESTNCGSYLLGSTKSYEESLIRDFLDLNGLVNVSVSAVANGSSKHYYNLNCDSMNIDTLPPYLAELRLKQFSVAYTKLKSVPEEIFTMATLTYLDISGNEISELPGNVGFLESLVTLDMGYNYLTELPESILNLENIQYLYINGNMLYNLPSHLRTWIDTYSLDDQWEKSQR